MACLNADFEMVQILVEKGADLTAQDKVSCLFGTCSLGSLAGRATVQSTGLWVKSCLKTCTCILLPWSSYIVFCCTLLGALRSDYCVHRKHVYSALDRRKERNPPHQPTHTYTRAGHLMYTCTFISYLGIYTCMHMFNVCLSILHSKGTPLYTSRRPWSP